MTPQPLASLAIWLLRADRAFLLGNSTNDPAEKGRHFAGLCLTVFSKRRQEAGKNTVEGAIKLVRFERSISGNQRLKKIRAPIDNGR
jgi:hypothetical protein